MRAGGRGLLPAACAALGLASSALAGGGSYVFDGAPVRPHDQSRGLGVESGAIGPAAFRALLHGPCGRAARFTTRRTASARGG
jgi:hypothetical protein